MIRDHVGDLVMKCAYDTGLDSLEEYEVTRSTWMRHVPFKSHGEWTGGGNLTISCDNPRTATLSTTD